MYKYAEEKERKIEEQECAREWKWGFEDEAAMGKIGREKCAMWSRREK